jgi:hypothetical protein
MRIIRSAVILAFTLAITAAGVTNAATGPAPSGSWWAQPPITTCGLPAKYRIDGGKVVGIGSCAANLLKPAGSASLHVGDVLQVHMLTGGGQPLFPLPKSPDRHVLRLVTKTDGGATGAYRAVGPGTVVLMSSGPCLHLRTGRQTDGPCPVLKVTVVS